MTDPALRLVYVVSRWNQETETFVRREVAAGLDAGAVVQVVSLKRPGRPDGIVNEQLIEVHRPSFAAFLRELLPTFVRRPAAVLRALAKILVLGRPGTWLPHLHAWTGAVAVWSKCRDADVIMAHFAWLSATTGDVLSSLTGTPYAIFPHAHDIYEARCTDRYLSDRLRRAAAVFVESEQIARDVRREHGVEPTVMRMGVPQDFIVRSVRARPSGRIVSIGALREKKGHDLTIRALVSLPDDIALTIAGEGRERRQLECLAQDLGLQDRVSLPGHADRVAVRTLLDGATAFCLPSRLTASGDRDGVPNVLIEAMARGVPVVATRVSGIPDLLEDGCGILVPPEDVDALSEALRTVLFDEATVARLTRNALERVTEHYTTANNWQLMEACLRESIGLPPLAR